MRATKIIYIYLFIICLSCNEQKTTEVIRVKEIKPLSSIEIALPAAPGAETVQRNCLTCHSLAYITMQPPLNQKSWKKIIEKMVKNFGAPVNEKDQEIILRYLVTIRGK